MWFVTQDGCYEWLRMPFGLKAAPAHFQYSVMVTLSKMKDGQWCMYIDNIVIHGNQIEDVWTRTVEAIKLLT